jgi:ubiquinone/menaquinone biosynthesis C-methylase UbiE
MKYPLVNVLHIYHSIVPLHIYHLVLKSHDMNSNFSSSPRGNFDRKPSFGGPRKTFGDRPSAGGAGPRPTFGDRKPSFGSDRGGGPSFGDRGPRPAFGDRKPFGDRPSFGDRGPRPSFGDRKPFGDRPSFGDRGPRPSFGDRPRPSFGDRKPFGDRPSFGDRGPRQSFGDRKPFGDRPSFGDRGPRPSFGDRKPFGDRPSFGDRGPRPSFGDRPRPSFGDRKPFGDRPSFGDRKPSFGDRGPRPSSDERPKSGEDRFPAESQYRVKRDFSQDFDKQDSSKSISGDQMKDAMASASNSEDAVRPRKQRAYMREEGGSTQKKAETSWGEVASWYDNHLESDSDTYHNKVILPNLMRLIAAKDGERILDIACGQGFFTRRLQEANPNIIIEGVDLGEDLIAIAKKRSPKITYTVGNAEDFSQYSDNSFDTAYIVLAIQNIEHLDKLISETSRILKVGGTFHIVMNHPAFRIPKETSWEYVDEKAVQARRVDAYLSDSKSEMDMHPGMFNSPKTLSFHRSMQTYFKQLAKFGFAVDRLEEWISHKVSDNGPRMDAENKARKEIPMFMYLRAKKY